MDELYKQIPLVAGALLAAGWGIKMLRDWLQQKDQQHNEMIKGIVKDGREDAKEHRGEMKTLTDRYDRTGETLNTTLTELTNYLKKNGGGGDE